MAGTKNHDYHILPPDIWPLIGAFSALTMTSGHGAVHARAARLASSCCGSASPALIATFFSG